jgi:hypothetical protein
MALQDVVVGVVAGCLGLYLIAGAATNGRWLMELGRPRMLVAALGPAAARISLGLLGVGLVALGVAVALGWRVHWS